jgi:uncharacterized protein
MKQINSTGLTSLLLRCIVYAILLCCSSTLANALDFPALTGRVVDQAGIISAGDRSALEMKLKGLEDQSGIQLVVATVPSLQGADIETFANELFRHWRLGEAAKNNGVLLLIAPNEHRVRIEVGYGLEGTLTDALSNVIITSAVIPRFKANDYAGGIQRGVDGIISVLRSDASEWQTKANVRADDPSSLFDELAPILLFGVFIFIIGLMARGARGASPRRMWRGSPTMLPPSIGLPSGGGYRPTWGGGIARGGGFVGRGGSSGGGGASGRW